MQNLVFSGTSFKFVYNLSAEFDICGHVFDINKRINQVLRSFLKEIAAMASTSKQSKEEDELRQESKKLTGELNKMQNNPKQYYIERLHEYNEVKDAAQAVFGALATFERVTVGEMQKKYLPENLKDP